MTGGTVAQRYARALLEIGIEDKCLETLRKDLGTFADAYAQSNDLRVVLHNPSIVTEDRKALVKQIGAHLRLSPLAINVLQLLVDKDRMQVVTEISTVLGELTDVHDGILRARVTAAQELDAGQKNGMQTLLSRLTGKKVIVETDIDAALLGGVITRVGGKVYDGSLRTQLEQLRAAAAQQL